MASKKLKNSAHLNLGNRKDLANKIAFVFSCPGEKEKKEKRPVAGPTGENLTLLLSILKNKRKEFISEQKYDYRITNAYKPPLSRAANNGKSEATLKEIYKSDNLKRLIEELENVGEIIICFGVKSIKALDKIQKEYPNKIKARVIPSQHLGFVSLNRIDLTPNKPADPTLARLKIVAQNIIEELNK